MPTAGSRRRSPEDTDSWSFQNVGTGQYLTAGRHGGVGTGS